MKTEALKARRRTEIGSRACRKLRSQGEIPANLYGCMSSGERGSFSLAVSSYDMMQLINKGASLLEVSFDDRTELVQVVEVQRDSFGDDVLHVDMQVIDADKPIESTVRLVFKGESRGVKEGGKLLIELKRLEIEALPRNTPREIVVRVDGLGLNDTLTVGDLTLPEGVSAITDPGQLVAHVILPSEEEEVQPEAPSEPEVIGKGKKEEEPEE